MIFKIWLSTVVVYLTFSALRVEVADALNPLPPRPIKCGRHERFSACAPPIRCQKFCPSQTIPDDCPSICLPGCVCEPGYVRDIRKGTPCIRGCSAQTVMTATAVTMMMIGDKSRFDGIVRPG